MEGSAGRFLPSTAESLFSGSQKLTLLFGGLSRDWDCTLWGSAWGWLWLWALTWPLEWPLEQFLKWALDWFLDQVLGQLLLWLWTRDLPLHLLLSLSRSLCRASAVSRLSGKWPIGPPHRIVVGPIQPPLLHGHLDLQLWQSMSASATESVERRGYPV